MDPYLAKLVDEDTPKMNPDLAGGLAMKHLQQVEAYIDSVFRAVAKGFPEWLQYVKLERCTPQQEYDELTRKRHTRREYDSAHSTLYMVRYTMRYRGEEIHRYLQLPYAEEAGIIYISGSRFVVSPILADRVLSIGVSNIFLRLLRAKCTFERLDARFKVDGVPETQQVVWSLIYNKDPAKLKNKPIARAKTTLVHYMFAKYGFYDAMKHFANCTPIVGNSETINPTNYPPEEWVICSSAQIKPKTYMSKMYLPSYIRVAVRRDEFTPQVRNYLCGFFYVVDHFPNRFDPEHPEYLDNPRLWRTLMGHLLFGTGISEGKLDDDIIEHIKSLDEYVDEVMKIRFRDIGLPITDIYQLFDIMILKFNEWLLSGADKINSMYEKELSILYYVCVAITEAISKFYFRLKSASRKELTKKEVESILSQSLKPGLIYSINKGHGEVSSQTTPGDNMAFKLTSILVPQGSSTKAIGKKDNATLNDPSKRLHVSIAEIGGYANIPKAAPDGRSRLNPHALTDAKGNVLRNPLFMDLLDNVQEMIKRN